LHFFEKIEILKNKFKFRKHSNNNKTKEPFFIFFNSPIMTKA